VLVELTIPRFWKSQLSCCWGSVEKWETVKFITIPCLSLPHSNVKKLHWAAAVLWWFKCTSIESKFCLFYSTDDPHLVIFADDATHL
jgi:hypothetical protein